MKNKLYGLVQGLRLSVSIPAGILVHIGSKLDGIETNWLLAVTVSAICGLTMLTNDYFDRFHDRIKRKMFAWQNDKLVRNFLFCAWILILIVILALLPYKIPLITISIVCVLYSYTRRIYGLPLFTTAIISASAVLISNLWNNGKESIDFFILTAIAIFAREIIKDAEDIKYDVGYKKTVFTESLLEEHSSWIRIAGFCFLIVGTKVLLFAIDMGLVGSSLCITGAECIIVSGLMLVFIKNIPKKFKSKIIFDFGMFMVLLSLCI